MSLKVFVKIKYLKVLKNFVQKNVKNSFIQNNIFYADKTAAYENQGSGSTGNTWSNNLYFNGTAAEGSISTTDPKFTNAATGDFSLQASSPAINKGLNTASMIGLADVLNNTRIFNTTVDLGAYEYGSRPIVTALDDFATTDLANQLSLYPNPFNNSIKVISNADTFQKVEIINSLGKLVFVQKANGTEANIDLSHLSSGLYFVKISYENTIVTKEIIKN